MGEGADTAQWRTSDAETPKRALSTVCEVKFRLDEVPFEYYNKTVYGVLHSRDGRSFFDGKREARTGYARHGA